MFVGFGLGAVIIGQDYPMGSAGRMGPGYFPIVLGGILSALGLIGVVRSLIVSGEAMEKFAIKQTILILLSVLLFGLLMRGAGLAISLVVLVMVSAIASTKFEWKSSVLLAIGGAIFCVLVFVIGLGVPMPIFGAWFGN